MTQADIGVAKCQASGIASIPSGRAHVDPDVAAVGPAHPRRFLQQRIDAGLGGRKSIDIRDRAEMERAVTAFAGLPQPAD